MFRCRQYVTIALLCFGLASFSSIGSMPARAADPALVGAGDIAGCNSSGDEATAALLNGIGGTVFTAGDNVYDAGTNSEFADCYQPSWGRHKARTRPSAGNHEYGTTGAAGYLQKTTGVVARGLGMTTRPVAIAAESTAATTLPSR